ncbi:hypothetical protein GGQ85_002519 [Nitrobacter vulgaris]|jgi:hypothetical protein|uniref:DUF2019 domain-containing protein n=1 Tax=Nitrobacter vulgaris TaxID=29421 RepID=UPI00286764B8|nr:DUF2019 domain-containing protein [Nitrobacter vulgaris]MDR6304804.1 hypothetical protein [Nitrobacter vulgaris]
MKRANLKEMSSPDLVERFTEIGVAQDQALLGGQTSKFNRLFKQMVELSNELKKRDGDQRRALASLYQHPNMQVRLKAAIHTREVLPVEARQQIEAIAESHWMPQAGDAGMALAIMDGDLKLAGLKRD